MRIKERIRKELEKLISRFDVDKGLLHITTGGRVIIDESLSAILAIVG